MAKRAARSRGRSTSARSTRRTPATGAGAKPPPVRVRMYRQGLGDCFLVTFGQGRDERHMLIDCGTLGTRTPPNNKMKTVLDDIRTTTGGRLAVLVATHEHQDHVSGFRNKDFELEPDHVWLAWTEDPSDELAKQIAIYKNDLAMAIGEAVRALAGTAFKADEPEDFAALSADERRWRAARDILGFAGEGDLLGADKFARTVDEAMKRVRDGFNVRPTFHKPAQPPVELPEIPGFRFYILGPPRDEEALKREGAHGSSHLYALRLAAKMHHAAIDPSVNVSPEEKIDCELQMPFDMRFRRTLPDDLDAAFPNYDAPEHRWRQVNTEWLNGVADFALQLDKFTNNTSLAFAIERIADGRVLLFPADAQEGNWVSWHDDSMKWKVKDAGGGERTVTAADLLSRTVFYKVGHHGSHNATMKEQGLELMRRTDELVAFIPVDRALALKRNPPGSWKMPARALYRRLLEKCNGRVMRSDLGWAAAAPARNADEKEFRGLAPETEWTKWKASQQEAEKHVSLSDLYAEYKLA